MQSFDYISEKLGVSPTLNPFLGMYRTLCADLRTLPELRLSFSLYFHAG